jgi:predicted NAD/FAD-dependent oxidoreductase
MQSAGKAISKINMRTAPLVVADRNDIIMRIHSIHDPSHATKILEASELTCHMKILVIGAGMCGLTAAGILQEAGHRVVVVDKGRGVGGRMATRRIDEAVFDHGAQFLTARSEWFINIVSALQEAGIVSPWFTGDDAESHIRYRGATSMNAIAKHLAYGLDVRTSTVVTSIRRAADRWTVAFDSGDVLSCDACIITAPIPQSLALVHSNELDLDAQTLSQLQNISYDPCFAVLATLDGPSGQPTGGPLRPVDSTAIALISDNQKKGVSPAPCITIHSTVEFARQYIEDPETAHTIMIEEVSNHFGSAITSSVIHRWRYAQPSSVFEAPFGVLNSSPLLLLAGDAFGGPRIEGAALSGRSAADYILGR